MKCLIKYKWIKLPRDLEIDAKGTISVLQPEQHSAKELPATAVLRTLWSPECGQVESLVLRAFWALRNAW